MCGITGIINPKKGEDIKAMNRAIAHRGPDDEGYFSDERAALGMRRLSIIDLGGGHQPIASPDGRFLIFFNGEIYNYREIRSELGDYKFKTESDTETILAGYVKWGEGVLERLRGMFVFAIYDKSTKEVFVARDFFGIKPLYYLSDGESVRAFSSELKSFLELPGFAPEINDAAVYNYLSFQYNPLAETFLKGVFKLPPGHFMRIDAKTGTAETKRYWQFAFKQNSSLDEGETKKKILETMRDSVEHHMIADVPVGSFLSGGIDSSIIATLMQKVRGNKKIKTFTVGFHTLSEGREAMETAEPLGTEHSEIRVGAEEYFKALPKAAWHFDEPVADPSAIGLYFLAQEARKHVKVVLSGEGSDELFGGYNIYLEPFALRWISWLPKSLLKFIANRPNRFFGKNYIRRASKTLEERYIGNARVFDDKEIRKLWRGEKMPKFSLDDLYKETKDLSDSTRMQYVDIHTWLIGDILAKADKMTMAHSLELRVPFLDVEVAKLAATLPDRFKWRWGKTKYLLREAFKGVLPERVRKRKKLGFPTPVRDWFTAERTELYKLITENPYVKKNMSVPRIEELITEHVSKKADNSRKIYLLLMFAIWYNALVDRQSS